MALTLTYTERKWDDLITDIKNERIVPIIGTEAIKLYFERDRFDLYATLQYNPISPEIQLLQLPSKLLDKLINDYNKNILDAEGGFLLYDYLTYKLSAYCLQNDIENHEITDEVNNLNIYKAAFFFILHTDKNLWRKRILRDFIKSEMDYLRERLSHTSLDNLAKIPFFGLYISLTTDNFLAESLRRQSLNEDFFRRNAIYATSLYSNQDFSDDNFTASNPRMFSLYGNYNETLSSDFSILEEEIIESICRLGVTESKPKKIVNYLKNRNVLLIGCKYSDWLLGFLLRLITENRLSISGTKKIFADKSFELCQTYLTQDYEVYIDRSEAIDFINKLYVACAPTEGKKIDKGGVFISFHSDDRTCAENLKNILVTEGIPAWFDEDGLRGGNDISQTIKDNINISSVFVCLLSKSNLSEPDRYFMKEWIHAKLVQKEFRNDLVIIPIIIDETIAFDDPFVTEQFPNIKNLTLLPKRDSSTCIFDKQSPQIRQLTDLLRRYVRDYRMKYNYR